MAETVVDLKTQLAQLPEQDRAELAHFLIGSLDSEVDADIDTAWVMELERRKEEITSGRANGIPAEQVFARLREKYG